MIEEWIWNLHKWFKKNKLGDLRSAFGKERNQQIVSYSFFSLFIFVIMSTEFAILEDDPDMYFTELSVPEVRDLEQKIR